jgi:hypothetical protein
MTTRFFIALFALFAVTQTAFAGYQLRFQTNASVVSGVAQFAPGSPNTVELWLDATDGDAATLAAQGLLSADMGAVADPLDPITFPFVAGSQLINITGNPSIASVASNAALFDTRGSQVVGGNQAAWLATHFGAPVTGSSSLLLGSFNLVAGTTNGDAGTLRLFQDQMNISLGDGTQITFAGNLDFNFVSDISAVPEPGAFALMGFAVAGGAAFLRRRKAATQPAAPAKE